MAGMAPLGLGRLQAFAEAYGMMVPMIAQEGAVALMEGRSGVAIMDFFAGIAQTGYLHNHARMWWASFWFMLM